jgi:Spy/CpxP family protein refolding chaperone
MKCYLKLFSILLATCVLGLMTNQSTAKERPAVQYRYAQIMTSGYGLGYEMGPGALGAYGMGPFMTGIGYYAGLDLSNLQKRRISIILKEVRAKHWALMDKMIDAQEKLQELHQVDKLDTDAINKQYEEIDSLRRERRNISIEAHNRINGVLDKDQLEKAKKLGLGYHLLMWGY